MPHSTITMNTTQNTQNIAGAHSRHSFDRTTRITTRGYPHRRRIWRTPAPQHAIVTRNHTSVLSQRQGPQHTLGRRHRPSHCFRRTDFHQRRRHKVDHMQVPVAPKEYSNSRRSVWSGPSESDTIHAFRLHNRGTRDRRSIAQRERTRVRRLISPVDNIGLPRLYRCGICRLRHQTNHLHTARINTSECTRTLTERDKPPGRTIHNISCHTTGSIMYMDVHHDVRIPWHRGEPHTR
jgi:hypothetical protein